MLDRLSKKNELQNVKFVEELSLFLRKSKFEPQRFVVTKIWIKFLKECNEPSEMSINIQIFGATVTDTT